MTNNNGIMNQPSQLTKLRKKSVLHDINELRRE